MSKLESAANDLINKLAELYPDLNFEIKKSDNLFEILVTNYFDSIIYNIISIKENKSSNIYNVVLNLFNSANNSAVRYEIYSEKFSFDFDYFSIVCKYLSNCDNPDYKLYIELLDKDASTKKAFYYPLPDYLALVTFLKQKTLVIDMNTLIQIEDGPCDCKGWHHTINSIIMVKNIANINVLMKYSSFDYSTYTLSFY